MKKTGLILEGGAMRGMFTCGVIDVFMENNITFDGAIGVSAGAVFGCNYKSKQIGRAIRYNKKYCNDKRYASFRSLITTGNLFGADFCYREIPEKLDIWDYEAFEKNPMEFYVTCTDIVTGNPVYHKCTDGRADDIKWMRASASMPLVSKIVEIDSYKLLDGGISDSIPIKYFKSLGYNRNVIILTQPIDYIKEKNQVLPLAKLILRKYPNLIQTMANRHINYNNTTKYIREKEMRGEIFAIRPTEALNIGKTEKNPDELERVYQIGRKTAINCLEKMNEFLNR